MMRLGSQAGEVIDRTRELTFTWNGRAFPAYEGDTIVSALAAAGERVFSRSLKYHRPRGLLTASFHDPGCIVQVGDEPNVRGAHALVTEGMTVSSQDTWPSLRFDAKAVNRFAGRFLTAGFYYKTFIRPQALWPAYESVLRRFTHGGTVSPDTPHLRPSKRFAHPDVLVAGGGPAGLYFAIQMMRREPAHLVTVIERNRPYEPEFIKIVGTAKSLADNVQLALAAHSIRIEAPIPGKAAGGIADGAGLAAAARPPLPGRAVDRG